MKDYKIELSFLGYGQGLPHFTVYRQPRSPSSSLDDRSIRGYSLPVEDDKEDRKDYWISFEPREGFDAFSVHPDYNRHLTIQALSLALKKSAKRNLAPNDFDDSKSFYREVCLNFTDYLEGTEQLVCEPYYLRDLDQYGWLLDFHFKLKPGVAFSRKVQQLSLSLDKNYKRNLNAYIDRKRRILKFYEARKGVFDNCRLEGQSDSLILNDEFSELDSSVLQSKLYFFSNNKTSRGQYIGLKDYGPLRPIKLIPKLIFIFEERYRCSARKLATAILGTKDQVSSTFPGFSKLFKANPFIDSNPIVIQDSSLESFRGALELVKEKNEDGYALIPILVLPHDGDNGYLEHKAIFAHAGIPSQVCTLRIIDDQNSLKWSIANIALQVFCKCGGSPWKVRPTSVDSLIIGIGQSHRRMPNADGDGIERFFAFSVMTDNSGLFKEIEVLADHKNEKDYLTGLRSSLSAILEKSSVSYRRVVLHTSFRLKKKEIQAIQDTVNSVSSQKTDGTCQFAVVKINQKNRFFGFNPETNNLVPYEGSYVKLGAGEYLMWFEGIYQDRSTVNKAFPGPTHVHILKTEGDRHIPENELLQDLLNLSGANWRGFNAKSVPVSVFYCHLIAEMVRDFQEKGLPMPAVTDLKPWFL